MTSYDLLHTDMNQMWAFNLEMSEEQESEAYCMFTTAHYAL